MTELVTKYWTDDLRAVVLRNEGNRLFQRGDVAGSLAKYSEALQCGQPDHLTASNRSHAYYKCKQYQEALVDANTAIRLKPDWGKSYFRKGMVLTALENYEEALIAYFQCFILEDNCSKALRNEMYKVLYKLITCSSEDSEQTAMGGQSEESEGGSEEEGQDEVERGGGELLGLVVTRNPRLCAVLDRVDAAIKCIITMNCGNTQRNIDPAAVDKDDFDCSLCFRFGLTRVFLLCSSL